MAKTDWKRLEKLAGGPIFFWRPPLDTSTEVWLYAKDDKSPLGHDLRIWTRDKLLSRHAQSKLALPKSPVTHRATLYQVLSQLFVDVEVRGADAVVRRGVLNGHFVPAIIAAGSADALLEHYRALGFRDGTPWNATTAQVTRRDYRKGSAPAESVWVDGDVLVSGNKKLSRKKMASREEAIAAAEKLIAKNEKAGRTLSVLELERAAEKNAPPPARRKAAAAKEPKRVSIPKPKTAFEAVDAAIAVVADLHTRFPKGHAIVELLDPKRDAARLEGLGHDDAFFRRMHKKRFQRWAGSANVKPKRTESSFEYFARRYGSLTWIVDPSLDVPLGGFHVGEVSGGGFSHLEIDAAGTYDSRGLAKAMKRPELAALHVFHGGWHQGRAFALDTRAKDAAGERPILPFDEGSPELPSDPTKTKIVPFGFWLYERVRKVGDVMKASLAPVND